MATLFLYLYLLFRQEGGRDAWLGGFLYLAAFGMACLVCAAAIILSGASGALGAIRAGAALALGSGLIAPLLFFGLLANCRLHCTERRAETARSADGAWKAIWYIRNCTAACRYCAPTSSVVLYHNGPGAGSEWRILALADEGAVRLEWRLGNELVISYSTSAPIPFQRGRAGPVRVEYVRIGWM